MGQETAPFINSLNPAWPLNTDKIRFGAVHLRTIKDAILNTFPSVTGAVTLTHSQINEAMRLSARNVLTNTLSGAQAPLQLESSAPGYVMKETDADADEKTWRQFLLAGVLRSDVLNDSDAGAVIWRRIFRTGTTIDEIEHTATLFNIIGKMQVSGAIEVGHASDTSLARSRAGHLSMEGLDIGFLGMPLNTQAGDYTLVLDDSGKAIYHASGAGAGDTYTIPANASVAFPGGTCIAFINLATDELEITIDTDNLRAMGSGSTGPFFLPQFCMAAAVKYNSTAWLIAGQGLHT